MFLFPPAFPERLVNIVFRGGKFCCWQTNRVKRPVFRRHPWERTSSSL